MFAALSAAENMNNAVGGDISKVNVLAIDKAARIAGTAAVTGDIMSVNPPRMMDEFNEGKPFVDEQEFWDDWMDFCLDDPKEEILRMFFEESGKAIDWAHYDHGFMMGTPGTGFTARDRFNVKHQASNGHAYGNYKTELAELHYNVIDQYEELGGKYSILT